MELKIEFELPHGTETLIVKLIDNPGVSAWAEHCRKLPSARSVSYQTVAPGRQIPLTNDMDAWAQQQLVQNSLASTKLPIPMPVELPEQITQQHLNVWHRWFTQHTDNISKHNREWATEFHWLHELNQIVHRLEIHVYEWPKGELGSVGKELNLQPAIDQHGFGLGCIYFDSLRQYHGWEAADLILDQAVHGKTTMQSFLDNDDPRHWDTTGHHMSWGGCKLINGNYRQEIYQGQLFNQWLERNQVTKEQLWGDYPLGHIVDKDQTQIDKIFRYHNHDFKDVNVSVL